MSQRRDPQPVQGSGDGRRGKRSIRRQLLTQLPLLVLLIGLWVLLWGSVSPLTILTGVVVALLVTRVFYLPPAALSDRVNPWRLVVFVATFLGELVVASFQVALQALAPRPLRKSSIVAVQLRSSSDLVLTLSAITLSLVPGSLVIELDRERSIAFVHVLNTDDDEKVEKAKRHVLLIEERIIRALGTTEDLRRLES